MQVPPIGPVRAVFSDPQEDPQLVNLVNAAWMAQAMMWQVGPSSNPPTPPSEFMVTVDLAAMKAVYNFLSNMMAKTPSAMTSEDIHLFHVMTDWGVNNWTVSSVLDAYGLNPPSDEFSAIWHEMDLKYSHTPPTPASSQVQSDIQALMSDLSSYGSNPSRIERVAQDILNLQQDETSSDGNMMFINALLTTPLATGSPDTLASLSASSNGPSFAKLATNLSEIFGEGSGSTHYFQFILQSVMSNEWGSS